MRARLNPCIIDALLVHIEGVGKHVDVVCANALACRLSLFSACFLYLLPEGTDRVAEKLEKELFWGSRVITYIFRLREQKWRKRLVAARHVEGNRAARPGAPINHDTIFLYIKED